MLKRDDNVAPKFEDGQIINPNECYGFYVLPLAICARDSAWDFPSFVGGILGLSHLWPDDWPGMWPTREDATIIADAMDFEDPKCREKFINEFPLEWDT